MSTFPAPVDARATLAALLAEAAVPAFYAAIKYLLAALPATPVAAYPLVGDIVEGYVFPLGGSVISVDRSNESIDYRLTPGYAEAYAVRYALAYNGGNALGGSPGEWVSLVDSYATPNVGRGEYEV